MMTRRYEALMERLHGGARILIDGATGTELERRGVPLLENAWNSGGTDTHPDVLKRIHLDYLEAGAELIISNTFGSHLHALEDAGAEDRFDSLNRRAVEIAMAARAEHGDDDILVAGGMSDWSWTGDHPPLDKRKRDAAAQAAILADAGCDFLMLEMMIQIDRLQATLDGALGAGLPVWVGITSHVNEEGVAVLRNGEPLSDALDVVKTYDVPVLNIMHTHVEDVDPSLDVVFEKWDRPVGVYADTGGHNNKNWLFDNVISPEGYVEACSRWMGRGVQIIGGCCGFGVDHIQALRPVVKSSA